MDVVRLEFVGNVCKIIYVFGCENGFVGVDVVDYDGI